HTRQFRRVWMYAETFPLVLFLAFGIDIGFVSIQFLRRYDVIAHACDFSDGQDAAFAVGQSTDLDNEIKRAGDLPTQAVFASLIARKARQHFYPVKAFT